VTITHAWREESVLKTKTVRLTQPGPYEITAEGDPVDEFVELAVASSPRE
jgi:hypothetical protein